MSADRAMYNNKGELITYTAAGRTKDPRTWAILDKQAKADAAKKVTPTPGRDPGKDPAGNPLPGAGGNAKGPIANAQVSATANSPVTGVDFASGVPTVQGGVQISQDSAREAGILAQGETPIPTFTWGTRAIANDLGYGAGPEESIKTFDLQPKADATGPGVQPGPNRMAGSRAWEILQNLFRFRPDEFKKIQLQLLAQGFYGDKAKKVQFGKLDASTFGAFGAALGEATKTGDLDIVLGSNLSPTELTQLAAEQTKSKKRTPSVYEVGNQVEDLQKIANEYMIPQSPGTLNQWATGIVAGKYQAEDQAAGVAQ